MNFVFQVQTFISEQCPVDENHFWNTEKNFRRILIVGTVQNVCQKLFQFQPFAQSNTKIVLNVANI